jgi:hypothetical protein
MALLHESVDFKKMDVRLIERNIARGVLSKEELDRALKNLPDDAENGEWVSLDLLSHQADESELNGNAHRHSH